MRLVAASCRLSTISLGTYLLGVWERAIQAKAGEETHSNTCSTLPSLFSNTSLVGLRSPIPHMPSRSKLITVGKLLSSMSLLNSSIVIFSDTGIDFPPWILNLVRASSHRIRFLIFLQSIQLLSLFWAHL